jgi:hypothetical protein
MRGINRAILVTAGIAAGVVAMLVAGTAEAKKKEKVILPDVVLRAKTVLVVILPDAGEPTDDPAANRKAREEVEKALLKWGRFQIALDVNSADLVIGVKRGSDKPMRPTVNGGPVDDRPVTIQNGGDTLRVGVAQGNPTGDVSQTGQGSPDSHPRTGMEASSPDDVFNVYLGGGVEYPLDGPPVWNYLARDGLKAPTMAAVEAFHKAVDEAEKAAQKKQAQQAGKKTQ